MVTNLKQSPKVFYIFSIACLLCIIGIISETILVTNLKQAPKVLHIFKGHPV